MQAKGIEPSSETYLNLLCGYAKAGKITEIRKIMSDCESKDIIFLDKDILEIVYTLAINNHFEYIDEILDKVKKQFGYHSQARLCVLRFVHFK